MYYKTQLVYKSDNKTILYFYFYIIDDIILPATQYQRASHFYTRKHNTAYESYFEDYIRLHFRKLVQQQSCVDDVGGNLYTLFLTEQYTYILDKLGSLA